MTSRYLLRFDDACPTMSKNWERIEKLCDTYGIKPIVAVIPENKDPDFLFEPPRANFWDTVRRWQDKEWTIALHGYNHTYVTEEGGLVPINYKSEFAGLSLERQREKIARGWNILRSHTITPTVWVAPAHSFDENTLVALREETDIRIISDGIAVAPFLEKGFSWIPQQLWSFKYFPAGLFTICLHPSTMTDLHFERLETDLQRHRDKVVSFSDVVLPTRQRSVVDRLFAYAWWFIYEKKRKQR